MLTTIKDVAKLAGVAVSTASYALSGNPKIKESTRKKVLEAAKSLNYKKNSFASALKTQSTKTIALILSDLSGPYYSEIIKGVQDTALQSGYDLIACSSVGGRESTGIKFLKERRVDGAIVLSPFIPGNMLKETAEDGFPIVVLDRVLQGNHLINVTVDNKQGGYKATEHLIQLGHTKIGFVEGPINTIDSRDRFSGYLEALNDYQLTYSNDWILSGNFTKESGYVATKKLLESDTELPTSLFYANDEMAIGGITAFHENGIRVPEDISIIGFDDIELAGLIHPPLTTVKQPKYEIGSLCTELLIQKLRGHEVTSPTQLNTEVIVRKSTRAMATVERSS